eukprot:8859288-Pyramimonas_sp.AAC.1
MQLEPHEEAPRAPAVTNLGYRRELVELEPKWLRYSHYSGKRIAANYENETEWMCENIERLGMEILGDSKTVGNWMCGEWQIRNK